MQDIKDKGTPHVLQKHNLKSGPTIMELKKELAVAEYGVKILNEKGKTHCAHSHKMNGHSNLIPSLLLHDTFNQSNRTWSG